MELRGIGNARTRARNLETSLSKIVYNEKDFDCWFRRTDWNRIG